MTTPFSALAGADLTVDAVYEGGTQGHKGADALDPLLAVGNAGGFRYRGSLAKGTMPYLVLFTTGRDATWPDRLDVQTGVFTYYGDNKKPGRELHEVKGNALMRDVFELAHGDASTRTQVPPLLVFRAAAPGYAVQFLGLAAPGAEAVSPDEQLVALWRSEQGRRFQNYRATFTVLDAPVVTRAWVDDLRKGQAQTPNTPSAWTRWVQSGAYAALTAPPPVLHRTRDEQLPADREGQAVLAAIHQHFADEPVAFERCAARLWRMLAPAAEILEVTRPSRDGGRDAVGQYLLGPAEDRVRLDFALEAKCYGTGNSVGVREMSRLISRLRFRQFGVLVTTSWVAQQAYEEVRSDGHPVIILSGADIVRVLKERGFGTVAEVQRWLDTEFVLAGP